MKAAGGRNLVFDVVKGVARIGHAHDNGSGCANVFTQILNLHTNE